MTIIPIAKPCFGPEELDAVRRPLESGWVVQGPFVREFEDKFGGYTGSAFAAAVSSCNAALHIAMAAMGLRPGDEVIVPAFTWVSTANVVEYMGARPVFCDIDLSTFNIDPALIEDLITEKTVGVMPVHLFGLSADMPPIMEIAKRRGLWVVEDAACALGGWCHGKHCGTFGDAGCFSFHPRKSITTGEGGMLTTAESRLDQLFRSLRDHGASRSDLARHKAQGSFLLPDFEVLGFNYRMTDIQGALGSAQMDRASGILARKQELADLYRRLLCGFPWLRPPAAPRGFVHGYQAFVCLFAPEEPRLETIDILNSKRNRLMLGLEEEGIATRQGTHAPPFTAYYSKKYGCSPADYPKARLAEQLSLALPLYAGLSDEDAGRVASALGRGFALQSCGA